MQDSSKGLLAAIAAFSLWGLLPLYLKALAPASSVEILCHRIVWSVVATLGLLFIGRKAGKLLPLLRDKKIMLPVLLAALLISGNWIVYIWSVNNDYIVESRDRKSVV